MVRKNQDTLTENLQPKESEKKTKEVTGILRLIHTNNITETNNLVHAGATLLMELMGIRIPQNSHSGQKPNQPPWKRCLEKQLTELRADLSKLNEMSASRHGNFSQTREHAHPL